MNIPDILENTSLEQDIHINFQTGEISVSSGDFSIEYQQLQEKVRIIPIILL